MNTNTAATTPSTRNANHCQKPSAGNSHANEMPLLETKSQPSQPETGSPHPNGPASSSRSGRRVITTDQKMIWTRSGMLRIVSM